MKTHNFKGFTLVELMVVLAIISILAMVALPAYLNYTTRSKVSEGIGMTAAAKSAVMDTYLIADAFPITNAEAGLGPPADYARQWVTGITIGDDPSPGTITVEINLSPLGTDNLLQLIPEYTLGGNFDWDCQPAAVNGVQAKFVPGSCR